MKLVLDEHYRIEPDGLNFTLIKEKEGEINPKTGKPVQTYIQWYPPTLKDALRSYVREKTKDVITYEDSIGVDSLLKKLEEIEEVITKATRYEI